MPLSDLHRRLMATWYDRAMARVESLCLADWRRELLAGLEGSVLEIGAGTGANLPFYPDTVDALLLSEPDHFMRSELERKRAATGRPARVLASPCESLDLPDACVATVVSTLVLCSVSCPETALSEIHRVLRPGGTLLFTEHVRSDRPTIHVWQRLLNPLWKRACGNCHLTRDTGQLLEQAGFRLEWVEETQMKGAPAIVRRVIMGRARKSDGASA